MNILVLKKNHVKGANIDFFKNYWSRPQLYLWIWSLLNIKDITIYILGHCTIFSLETAKKKIIKKIFSLKFLHVWYKRSFLNKYCDLLIYASFTKFTGPAKLLLNNNILHFLKKIIVTFGIFVVMKPAERSVK